MFKRTVSSISKLLVTLQVVRCDVAVFATKAAAVTAVARYGTTATSAGCMSVARSACAILNHDPNDSSCFPSTSACARTRGGARVSWHRHGRSFMIMHGAYSVPARVGLFLAQNLTHISACDPGDRVRV